MGCLALLLTGLAVGPVGWAPRQVQVHSWAVGAVGVSAYVRGRRRFRSAGAFNENVPAWIDRSQWSGNESCMRIGRVAWAGAGTLALIVAACDDEDGRTTGAGLIRDWPRACLSHSLPCNSSKSQGSESSVAEKPWTGRITTVAAASELPANSGQVR